MLVHFCNIKKKNQPDRSELSDNVQIREHPFGACDENILI